jgi:hypothetical protein
VCPLKSVLGDQVKEVATTKPKAPGDVKHARKR